MKLLLATANGHKVEELRGLLREVQGLELVSLRDFPEVRLPEETGATMRENAGLKAVHCARATGLPSLADDSGIEVDALGGEPGVRSARWSPGSDRDRAIALLKRLEGVPAAGRGARYRCAICLAVAAPAGRNDDAADGEGSDEVYAETEAICEGTIGFELRGDGGFGYDPSFVITRATGAAGAAPSHLGQTLAEAPAEFKAGVSHRARAVAAIVPALRRLASVVTDHGS